MCSGVSVCSGDSTNPSYCAMLVVIVEPSKFRAIRNSGYFSFLSISHFGEVLELPFSAELKTTCLHLNMVYKMYLSCNFE